MVLTLETFSSMVSFAGESVKHIAAKRNVSLISDVCLSSAINWEHARTLAVSSDILMLIISLQYFPDPHRSLLLS